MNRLEELEQQVDELDAVESVHPGALELDAAQRSALALVRGAVSGHRAAAAPAAARAAAAEAGSWLPDTLCGTLRPPDAGGTAALRFELPRNYPGHGAGPRFALEARGPRAAADALSADLAARVESEWRGAPCLLLAVDWLVAEAAPALSAAAPAVHHESSGGGAGPAVRGGAPPPLLPPSLLRVAVWFHHIASPSKRRNLVAWARELGLRGASKPGFPGAVVVEGDEGAVREYLRRVRALGWQGMQVRREERAAAGAWAFADARCAELPDTPAGLSELSVLCRDAGLGDLFAALLKI